MSGDEYDAADDSRRSYEAAVEAKRLRGDTHWPARRDGKSVSPIIEQMAHAADDRARAKILLAVPDAVLSANFALFQAACASFDLGLAFIDWRRASWNAVRGPDGLFADRKYDEVRIAFARYAVGGEHG